MHRIVFILFLLFTAINVDAQFNVTANSNANTLVSRLVGTGVLYSNPTLNCPNAASGRFVSAQTQCTMDSGIVLATGNVSSILGYPNNSGAVGTGAQASNDFGTTGLDNNLATAAGVPLSSIHDRCALEFDFVPYGDTIKFNYVFASEEYPDYNCTGYNDIFAFFISGNQYPTPTNLAKIPGTNIPVVINSINNGSVTPLNGGNISTCNSMGAGSPFTSLYITPNQGVIFEYDGRTVKLQAKAAVYPCSTYHMKFAIADVGDGIYDSGVFLESGSFRTDQIIFDSIQSPSAINLGYPYILESCDSVVIKVKRKNAKSIPQVVNLTVIGSQSTATNGVDCNTIPPNITIPAFDTMVFFTLKAINDNLVEGSEYITIVLTANECGVNLTDTIKIYILDFPQYNVSNDDTICAGQSTTLQVTQTITNPYLTFLWKPQLIAATSINVTPAATTTYTLTVGYPGCPTRDSLIKITVAPVPIVNAGPNQIICTVGSSVTLNGTTSNTSPFTSTPQWTPISTLASPNTITTFATPTTTTNYTLTVTNTAGCSSSDAVLVTVSPNYSLNVATSTISCTLPNGSFTVTPTVLGTYTYSLNPTGATSTTGVFTGLSAIIYTVTATNSLGCTKTQTVSFTGLNLLYYTTQNYTPITCNNYTNGEINLVATGGIGGTMTYTIQPGATTNTTGTFSNLAANTYTVTAADASGCSTSTIYNMSNPAALSWNTVSSTNLPCNNSNNGTIAVTVNNAQGAVTYANMGISTNNNGTFNNLGANTYTISATDSKLCSISTLVSITQPNILQISNINKVIPSCVPNNNGSITITAIGGTTNYSYNINGGPFQTTNLFSNLTAGTYTVVVKDINNCTSSSIVNIAPPPNPTISVSNSTHVSCYNGTNGNITVTGNGGTGVLNFSNGISSNSAGIFNSLIASIYTIIVTDAIGCTASTTNIITQPTVITNTISNSSILCNGDTSTITISANGGVQNFSYSINGSSYQNSNTFNQLAGTYTITIKDANNCTKTSVINITQPNILNGTITNTPILCFGNNSIITLTGSGGVPAYTYSYNYGAFTNSNTISTIANTPVICILKDINGCKDTTTVTITQPSQVQITNITNTTLNCVPANNATINITAIGGTGVKTYTLNGSSSNTTGIFTNNGAGVYTVVVKDANNCSTSSIYTINPPSIPVIQNVSTSLASCISANSGTATVNVTNGNTPYTYSINNGLSYQNSNIFGSLPISNYTVIVKDNLGCKDTLPFTIYITASPVILGITTTTASCSPGCDGTASINAVGGNSSSYTYSITGGITQINNNLIGNLCAASNYTITVTDANSCTTVSIFSISQATTPNITGSSIVNLNCNNVNNGQINITAISGTTPYNFVANGSISSTTGNFNNMSANSYNIVLTDAKGCKDTVNATITQPNAIVMNSVNYSNPLCNNDTNGNININASGGTGILNYQLNSNSYSVVNNFNNLASGIYTITIQDANSCTISTTVNLLNPAALSFTNATNTNNNCWNTSTAAINTSAIGGTGSLNYNLMPNNINNSVGVFNNLSGTTTYTITVTDINNCSINTQLTIQSPIPIGFDSIGFTPVSCFGLSNGSVSYTVFGNVGSYNVNINAGAYNQNNNVGIFNNVPSNIYTLTVTDANSCTATTTINVTQPALLTINAVGTQIACNGQTNGLINSSTSGGNGGNLFSLNGGITTNNTGTFNNLTAGIYTVAVTDNKNCTSSSTVTIIEPMAIQFNVLNQTHISCFNGNNGSISTQTTGGTPNYNYATNGGLTSNNGNFNNLSAGIYTIIITDAFGCTKTTITTLTQPNALVFNTANKINVKCFGENTGSIATNVTGGTGNISYTLLPNNINSTTGNFNNLNAGIYNVLVTDANSCTLNTLITITETPQLIFSNVTVSQPICSFGNDGTVSFNIIGGSAPYIFTINNTNPTSLQTFSSLGQGVYTIQVTDGLSCTASTEVALTQPIPLQLFIDSVKNVGCNSNNNGIIYSHSVGGIPPYIYYLKPTVSVSTTGTFEGLEEGIYTITSTDTKGCTGTQTTSILKDSVAINLDYTIKPDDCNIAGKDGFIKVTAIGGTSPYTYKWLTQPPVFNDTLYGTSPQRYFINVIDKNNCETQDTIEVLPTACCRAILPNAFSPNNDRINDVFKPIFDGDIEIQLFEIYDRWGNKIFAKIGNNVDWNGKFNNKDVDNGVYYYVLKYYCHYSKEVLILKGDVTLVR